MPKSRRSSSRSRSTRPSMAGTVSASRWTVTRRTVGTTHRVTAMPRAARPTISQKMPDTPTHPATMGPITSAIMNDRPMVMPTVAMALVRLSSRVRSATMARITEPTAPVPWITRPTMTPSMEVESAAIALPSANRARPIITITLRPMRSDRRPKGICRSPWLSP